MNDPEASKAKSANFWTSSGLELLGKIGLIGSSLLILVILFYHRSLNPWLPLWVMAAFAVSILLILIAAHRAGHHHHHRILFGQITLIVASFSSIGLLKFLSRTYRHRSLTNTEWSLGALALGLLIICIWRMTLDQRKQYKKQLNETDVFAPSNVETTTQRVLKASSRPYFFLGLAFGFIELLLIITICMAGDFSAAIIVGTPIPIIYAAICLFVINQKIIVGKGYLAYQRHGFQARAVSFKDITKSRVHAFSQGGSYSVLVPVLDVYTSDAKRPALRIPSGAFRQADIQWLTSLPEMKYH